MPGPSAEAIDAAFAVGVGDAAQWLPSTVISRGAPLAPQVYRLIRRAIVSAQLMPGQIINEPDVAGTMSVSRTPVREALLRLQREGLVEIRPQAGTFVTSIDWARVEEGMIVREALEVRAITTTVASLSSDVIDQLLDDTAEMQMACDAEDLDLFTTADDRFHRHLLNASGYRHIPSIIEEANGHLDRVRSLCRQMPQRMPQAIEEHQAIIERLKDRDATNSARAMNAHLQSSWTVLRNLGKANGLL